MVAVSVVTPTTALEQKLGRPTRHSSVMPATLPVSVSPYEKQPCPNGASSGQVQSSCMNLFSAVPRPLCGERPSDHGVLRRPHIPTSIIVASTLSYLGRSVSKHVIVHRTDVCIRRGSKTTSVKCQVRDAPGDEESNAKCRCEMLTESGAGSIGAAPRVRPSRAARMCWSLEVSLTTGVLVYSAAWYLWTRNATARDRWHAIFLATFGSMQWIDAALW